MFFHQLADGLSLAGAGVAEAQMTLDVGCQTQLVHAQFGVAALAVADDEEAVTPGQFLDGFQDARIADLALVFKEVLVFRIYAPLHEIVTVFGVDGGENHIGNFRHNLAEKGL